MPATKIQFRTADGKTKTVFQRANETVSDAIKRAKNAPVALTPAEFERAITDPDRPLVIRG